MADPAELDPVKQTIDSLPMPPSPDPHVQRVREMQEADDREQQAARAPGGVGQDVPAPAGKPLTEDEKKDPKKMAEIAADRAKAAEELEKKLDIVDDDHQGEKNPNQVTRAEFEKLVGQYSDVRMNRSDLKVDASSIADADKKKEFEQKAMNDIGNMLQTPSGRDLVRRLSDNANGNQTTITQKVVEQSDVDLKCGVPGRIGTPYPNSPMTVATDTSKQDQPGGTSATVNYGAGETMNDHGRPLRSDQVLFHELTHALHMTQGTADATPATEGRAIDTTPYPQDCTRKPPMAATSNEDMQALQIGKYGDPALTNMNELRYAQERQLLAGTEKGLPDDARLTQRPSYQH